MEWKKKCPSVLDLSFPSNRGSNSTTIPHSLATRARVWKRRSWREIIALFNCLQLRKWRGSREREDLQRQARTSSVGRRPRRRRGERENCRSARKEDGLVGGVVSQAPAYLQE